MCSLNNERTSIPKIVVLNFLTPTPVMNMYVKTKGNYDYIETKIGGNFMGHDKRRG
jgi:hypothetical protein